MKGSVEIHGMEFFAHHGCLPQERENGNCFLVDVICVLDLEKSCESDLLSDTLDCAEIAELAGREMATPSNLLENVAWRIRNSILMEFPMVETCEVSVCKKNPPLSCPAAYTKITVK